MINQVDVLRGHMEHIGGCGDGGCIVHVRPGMHTNGGCRCSHNPHTMFQVVHWHKQAVASQAEQIKRLRAVLMDFVEPFKNYPDGALKDDAKAFPNQALLLRARAALQPKEGE